VTITLGTSPVVLPPPLDELVRELTPPAAGTPRSGGPPSPVAVRAASREAITDDALGTRLKRSA